MNGPLYLYGVTPPGAGPPPGGELCAISAAGLSAIVGPFALGALPPETLEARMRSLEAVAPLAQRHQEVVAQLAARGPVVPARLCTLFSSPAKVRAFLVDQEGLLRGLLALVGGRAEWGLKVFVDGPRLGAALGAADAAARRLLTAAEAAGPGHGYVLRRQHEARLAALASARTDEVLDEVLEALWPHMHRHRERDLPAGEGGAAPVLHLCALIDEGAAEAWAAAVDGLAEAYGDEGFRFERSGPWPPYSFCGLQEAAAGDAADPPLREARP